MLGEKSKQEIKGRNYKTVFLRNRHCIQTPPSVLFHQRHCLGEKSRILEEQQRGSTGSREVYCCIPALANQQGMTLPHLWCSSKGILEGTDVQG